MQRIALFVAFVLLAVAPAGAVDVQKVVSHKGIVAWLVEEHSVPLVAMSFAFEGGGAQDPADKPGVANMLSGLLDEGAGDLDSEAYQSALDDASIVLSFDSGRDQFFGSIRTLSENRDEAARLLRLALTAPRFDEEPVERIRAQIISGIKRSARSPGQIASRTLMAAAFPGHPYGRDTDGTVDSVSAITTADLRAYFGKVVARDNLKISVVGDIDGAALSAMLDEVFGDLPAKADLAPVPDVVPAGPDTIDVGLDVPQAVIRFVGKGLKRDDPDFIPAAVAEYIVGGGDFSSRLYSEVREKRGLAYSVSLYLAPYDHAGLYFASTSTRADQADTVTSIIRKEIKRFADEGPTAEELAKAKAYMIGSYPLRFDTSDKIARQLLAIQLDNLGLDYIDKRNALIGAVTIDDVRRVAKRLFSSDDLVVVRVGPKAG